MIDFLLASAFILTAGVFIAAVVSFSGEVAVVSGIAAGVMLQAILRRA